MDDLDLPLRNISVVFCTAVYNETLAKASLE